MHLSNVRFRYLIVVFWICCFFLSSCRADSMKECSSTQDCEKGESCGLERKCIPEECRKEADCSSDSLCIYSVCRKKCASSSNCSNNTSCFISPLLQTTESVCLDISKIDSRDKGTFTEVAGSQKSCVSTTDCPSKEYCKSGRCFVADCSQDGDCVSGNVCITAADNIPTCRKLCARSSECKTGEACYEEKDNRNICFPKSQVVNGLPVDTSCQIRILSASISGCWDAPCGSADPVVRVYMEKKFVGETPGKTDNHSPVWDYDVPNEYSPSLIKKSLLIEMVDEDISSDDTMISSSGPWEIDKETVSITNQYVTLKIKFTCKSP